ncbi:MAG: hypothetical protein H7Y27_12295, partial [Gemmatimonadaceae bacterium]|nr:hypothetical protein [Chitinophagaceae bacterium]
MKRYFSGIAVILVIGMFLSSCKKTNDKQADPTEDLTTITEVGAPVGTAVKKAIDANGGQLSSADGTLQVIIPAGALATAKEISIQAITNKLGGGIGNA